jgi:hypothetical protein
MLGEPQRVIPTVSGPFTEHVLQPKLYGQGRRRRQPRPHHTNADAIRRRQHARDEVLPALTKRADGLDGTTTCSAPAPAQSLREPILSDNTS